MKHILNPKKLPPAVLLTAFIGFALRRWLYIIGPDGRNLLPAFHPLEAALWTVTALTVGLILAAGWKPGNAGTGAGEIRPSFFAALGHILLAAGILLTVLLNVPAMAGTVGKLWKLLGVVSAPVLLCAAFSRAQGKRPHVLTHVIPCVFFVLHLVCHYQTWCSNPQLQDYAFSFFGTIGLMFVGYYLAAADAGMGNRRLLLIAEGLTLYLCVVNLAYTEYLYLYLCGAVWTGTGLCDLTAAPAVKKEAGDADASA